ncbi:MAG TPA: hypothetical protein DDX89_06950 [Candidatus Omnitrophica bacterium]|nr:MAG: hypothetical protein A3B73_04700 [Omnitrophica WOR_2 bacterium RIFCSPHIGHO2_02_FULL_63_39]OGX45833.1 MAG: hypothetical protein A3I71_05030 [Omnitrophica WOR_2 bacterium RIFCSPLOWO2_02_FULL_63_16]OGX49677.1 MAG: hypothetical protein A3G88_03045 [Omnitrophica WOR_2 bacterium RIFCSPLOWO2_12_FULL_63_16]HBH97504.1 hypothetical protein [Candidatus Omnitrophota bacterium]
MTQPDALTGGVYRYPRYYAIGYQWNTEAECDFLEACLAKHVGPEPAAVLDIGCGAGRHLLELARRGHRVTGFDLRPEMVEFVNAEARNAELQVSVSVGDLRRMAVEGTYGLAICLMDTFRYLLTNDEILRHLECVASHLQPGGLYVTDFWVPRRWDQIGSEVYQWEQTRGTTTVRVFYVQHPDSVDPVSQTFEDELVLTVEEDGASRDIHGERTRTRLIMPQEFDALIQASGAFEIIGRFSDFDESRPLESDSQSWRMVSLLRKRP